MYCLFLFLLIRINPSGGDENVAQTFQDYLRFQLVRINPSGGAKEQYLKIAHDILSFQLVRINPSGGETVIFRTPGNGSKVSN